MQFIKNNIECKEILWVNWIIKTKVQPLSLSLWIVRSRSGYHSHSLKIMDGQLDKTLSYVSLAHLHYVDGFKHSLWEKRTLFFLIYFSFQVSTKSFKKICFQSFTLRRLNPNAVNNKEKLLERLQNPKISIEAVNACNGVHVL